MVSLPHPFVYSQKHGSHLPYSSTPSAWYPNYSSHHATHQMNNHILNGPTPLGTGLESDTAAPFYNAHHHMLHSSSPDWIHDNYNQIPNSAQFFANGMTPPSSLHLSPTINNLHSSNSTNANSSSDNLQNGLQNIPPSPPITVNSACSEMSSPGIGSNGNSGVIANGDASPSMTSANNLSRPKSPYEWMKKPSYQSQPSSGKTRTKDKYRVVYTDYQRLELEKEYHMSHYITIRRKSELATSLQLSERQVKIWFQNRRAKDRKQTKKRDGPVGSGGILANNCSNVGLALQHHNMVNGPSGLGAGSMYGSLDIKPKLEPGLLSNSHHYGHLHQAHATHPMHHLSTMSMNLLHHQSHMHHSAAAQVLPPTPISSSPSTSIQSQAHLSS
ncbi:homeotic protein caudal isoform X2 [Contarinia nasturtii]|uniref:homeotic protein caudal isoform X2 n=1 Tax=Contarinia nasturtii TaxID=265458 RepID=UPI0012D447E2|nr:homeotic protein caudal isoform X2 [Contarinia nasturtii]